MHMLAEVVAPAVPLGTLGERAQSALGVVVFGLIAYGIGVARTGRWRVSGRLIAWGLVLQLAFGALLVVDRTLPRVVTEGINHLLEYTRAGASLVFGELASPGGTLPVTGGGVGVGATARHSAFIAFFVLPTIIFFSMLMAILYHIGVLQWVVHGLSLLMRRTMRTSGAETLSAVANIFVGQTEAPLMVRPFIAGATHSELAAIMVGGFANIASGVLGVYQQMLSPFVQDSGGHLAGACFITAPGSLLIAKLMVPETETPATGGAGTLRPPAIVRVDANLLDAASRGTSEGLRLAVNVGAMLVAFTALLALCNGVISGILGKGYSLEGMIGVLFRPAAWLIGVPWGESRLVSEWLGLKTVLNEFVAYDRMSTALGQNPGAISPRSALLATYALCGFANFASIGIQIGGIATMAENRRHDLARLGLLTMFGGALTSLMAAAIIGVLK